ncbi:MAG TPA: hypothetical protein VIL97_00480 [Thermoanaerobaculia bacterium]
MKNAGKAPTMITWIICLILYAVALAGHFDLVKVDPQLETWAWIIGFGLLLLAIRLKGI